jgi:hypothetical protein
VDDNTELRGHEEDIMEISIDEKLHLDPKEISSGPEKKNNNSNFVASVGNVFRKALDGIKLLKLSLSENNSYSRESENSP